MKNGFGLKMLHKFFSLPFLLLQKETYLQQLARNESETNITIQEIDVYLKSDEADYLKYVEQHKRNNINTNKEVQTCQFQDSTLPNSITDSKSDVSHSMKTMNEIISGDKIYNNNISQITLEDICPDDEILDKRFLEVERNNPTSTTSWGLEEYDR